jgi:hypothetical protein
MHSFGLYSECSALQLVSRPMSQGTSGLRTPELTGSSRRTWLQVAFVVIGSCDLGVRPAGSLPHRFLEARAWTSCCKTASLKSPFEYVAT